MILDLDKPRVSCKHTEPNTLRNVLEYYIKQSKNEKSIWLFNPQWLYICSKCDMPLGNHYITDIHHFEADDDATLHFVTLFRLHGGILLTKGKTLKKYNVKTKIKL